MEVLKINNHFENLGLYPSGEWI